MNDEKFFDAAFWKVAASLEGVSREKLDELFREMRAAWRGGDMCAVTRKHLLAGGWRWPAYEAFARPRDESFQRKEARAIARYTLSDFLSGMRVPKLRALHRDLIGATAKAPASGKVKIIDSLLAHIDPAQGKELLARLRREAIDGTKVPWVPCLDEMTNLFAARVWKLAENFRHRAQVMRELTVRAPLCTFRIGLTDAHEMPRACRQRDGQSFRADDPVWDQVAPCDYLECSCRFSVCLPAGTTPSRRTPSP